MFQRKLQLPDRSFFLFGPRAVGKSTLLRESLASPFVIDLLSTRVYRGLAQHPEQLEAMIRHLPQQQWVMIDEVQRVPAILDEVHRLMLDAPTRKFALSGSSARKLKREGANLLAGRAVTRHMEGLSWSEWGAAFDLNTYLQWGSLPLVVLNPQQAADTLNAYIDTYIKEEIRQEGLVRKIEPFLRFLEIAGLLNGQTCNLQNIARDAEVPASNVANYFSILIDTLLGHWLPAYRPAAKVREKATSKFYWFDPGVARGAAGRLFDPASEEWLGFALETAVFHEIRVYNHVTQKNRLIAYYETGAASEIDFVIETRKRAPKQPAAVVAIEVKLAKKWQRKWENAARSLQATSKIEVTKMIGVYQGNEVLTFDDFVVLPVTVFFERLWQGEIF